VVLVGAGAGCFRIFDIDNIKHIDEIRHREKYIQGRKMATPNQVMLRMKLLFSAIIY
jgi:hypothetical protein